MKRCADCKFFGDRDPLTYYTSGDPGDYEEVESDHHSCLRIVHGNRGLPATQSAFTEDAVVTDGSGYAAKLRVLGGFGCSLWESK